MEAKEAKKITESNQISIEKIFEQIKAQCENGIKSSINHNVSDSTILELMKMGYIVSKFKNEHKVELTLIEW